MPTTREATDYAMANGVLSVSYTHLDVYKRQVVKVSIIVQITHVHTVDTRLWEFLCRTERFFQYSSCDNVFIFCSYERSAFSRFYMLEFNDLTYVSFNFDCDTVSEITCSCLLYTSKIT